MDSLSNFVRAALKRLIVWALTYQPTPKKQLRVPVKEEPLDRAEMMALLAASTFQHWTWQLEALKHLVVLNGAGLAATVTLSSTTIIRDKCLQDIVPFWIAAYGLGLYLAVLAMLAGIVKQEQERNEHIFAISTPNSAIEPSQLKRKYRYMWLFGMLSLTTFTAGTAFLIGFLVSPPPNWKVLHSWLPSLLACIK